MFKYPDACPRSRPKEIRISKGRSQAFLGGYNAQPRLRTAALTYTETHQEALLQVTVQRALVSQISHMPSWSCGPEKDGPLDGHGIQ